MVVLSSRLDIWQADIIPNFYLANWLRRETVHLHIWPWMTLHPETWQGWFGKLVREGEFGKVHCAVFVRFEKSNKFFQ